MKLQIEIKVPEVNSVMVKFNEISIAVPIENFSLDEINDYAAALVQSILDKWTEKQKSK